MPMTSYLRKALGDESIGKTGFTMPTPVYLALFTASPGDGGSLASEVTGGSYARIELTSKMGAFVLSTGIASNTANIDFATPTGNWGTVTYAGIADAASAGNLLYYEALPNPRAIVSGGRHVQFTIGAFQVKLI